MLEIVLISIYATLHAYDFSDFDVSSLVRDPFAFICPFIRNNPFRDDPYFLNIEDTYILRYNIFNVVGNWQGAVCDTTDCVAQAAWESGVCMCLGLNSTANTTFPEDGSGIITQCLLYIMHSLVLFPLQIH